MFVCLQVYGMRTAMKHLPPRRFWDEWKVTVSLKRSTWRFCVLVIVFKLRWCNVESQSAVVYISMGYEIVWLQYIVN